MGRDVTIMAPPSQDHGSIEPGRVPRIPNAPTLGFPVQLSRRAADLCSGREKGARSPVRRASPSQTGTEPQQDAGEIEGTMLLLTRKLGENIRIGDDVKITIVEVKGNHVKLGIDAPPSVKVHREEIYERIQAENRRQREAQATSGDAPGVPPVRDGENNGQA